MWMIFPKLPPSLRAKVLSVRMNVYGTVRAAPYGGAQLDEWLKPEHGLKKFWGE